MPKKEPVGFQKRYRSCLEGFGWGHVQFFEASVQALRQRMELVAWHPRIEMVLEVKTESAAEAIDQRAAQRSGSLQDVVSGVVVDHLHADIRKYPAAKHRQCNVHTKDRDLPANDERQDDDALRPKCFDDNPRPKVRAIPHDPARKIMLVQRPLAESPQVSVAVDIPLWIDRGMKLAVVNLMGRLERVATLKDESADEEQQDSMQPR